MLKFGYSFQEWEFMWSQMFENGAWDVPTLKNNDGSYLKENFAPEMMIRFAAHEIKCHIIVIDLQLSRIQFCSGNFLKDNNVIFNSPLILYATGNHFQSVFQIDHNYWIQLASELEKANHQVEPAQHQNISNKEHPTKMNAGQFQPAERSEKRKYEVDRKGIYPEKNTNEKEQKTL